LISSRTIPLSPESEEQLDLLRGHVRELSKSYRRGDLAAFVRLVRLLLSETVVARSQEARIHATYTNRERSEAYLGGPETKDLLQLRDDRFLRLVIAVYIESGEEGVPFLKVRSSSYQYQATTDNSSWIFRYDYLRESPAHEPGAHLQIRGTLDEPVLSSANPLATVQFPTRRVSLEAVIRLLALEFRVPTKEQGAVLEAVFTEAERAFFEIAHEPEPARWPEPPE
jgi:hypothetical protein